jgi:hypothetical protein
MVSPGNNAGKRAAAVDVVRQAVTKFLEIADDFGVGSKEFNAVMGAINKLNPVIGHSTESPTMAAGRRQLASPSKPPLAGMAPPGMSGGPRPPMIPPAAAMPGAGGEGPPEM